MRTAFIEALLEAAAADPNLWLLTGDLGFSVLEPFRDRFPNRFLNVGVAEQNMAGVAAGLALGGKHVFTYSIANFPVLRCFEQIRNDIAYHHLNVKTVAVGGGMAYASLGYSHHGVEDLAVMSALPQMTVVAPADPIETRAAVHALAATPGPAYLRLGKAGEPILHQATIPFTLGKGITLRSGPDLTLVSTGAALALTLDAARVLATQHIHATVISLHTLRPLDRELLLASAARTGALVTVEEHGPGGLASIAALEIATHAPGTRFRPVFLQGAPPAIAGSQEQLRAQMGLSLDSVLTAAHATLQANVITEVIT